MRPVIYTAKRVGVVRVSFDEDVPRFNVLARFQDNEDAARRYLLGCVCVDGIWYVTAFDSILMFDSDWKRIRVARHESFSWLHSVTERNGVLYVASCHANKIVLLDLSLNVLDVQSVDIYGKGLTYMEEFRRWKFHLNHVEPMDDTRAILSLAAVPALAIVDLHKRERIDVIPMPSMTHHPRVYAENEILVSARKSLVHVSSDRKVTEIGSNFGWLRGLSRARGSSNTWLSVDVYHHLVREFTVDESGEWSWRMLFTIPPQYNGHREYEVMTHEESREDITENLIAMGYL